jgi:hypothetical protein
MSKLADTIIHLLTSATENRKLTVGVLFQGNSAILQRLVADGHRTIVVGERFRILYSAYKQTRKASPPKPLMVEAHFNALPIRPGSLDALVLSQGLPLATMPQDTLIQLRSLLKDSGLFIWPHRVTNGIGGKIGRAFVPYRRGTFHAIPRDQLCTLAMESGFSEIGQVLITRKFIPWVITTGLATQRPWEKAHQKVFEA